MRYDYARPDGATCEIEQRMSDPHPERIVVTDEGWRVATDADPAETIFSRVFTVPATAGVVPTNSRSGHRRYRNNEGTLNIPAGEIPVSYSMPPVFEEGERKVMHGREVQEFKDGRLATVERDPETGKRCGGYPILDSKKNEDRWAKKLGLVNQVKL